MIKVGLVRINQCLYLSKFLKITIVYLYSLVCPQLFSFMDSLNSGKAKLIQLKFQCNHHHVNSGQYTGATFQKTVEKHLNGEHNMLPMVGIGLTYLPKNLQRRRVSNVPCVAPSLGSGLLIDWAILKFLYQDQFSFIELGFSFVILIVLHGTW